MTYHRKQPFRAFSHTLSEHGLTLLREKTTTLQINLGLMCNQTCRHCHLEAGPNRKEMMGSETMQQVVEFAERNDIKVVDITGGAPELHPEIENFIRQLTPLAPNVILRTNLTALMQKAEPLLQVLTECKTNIIASFPSINPTQLESIRGNGIFDASISALRKLNDIGYGRKQTSLCLDLIVNPSGAFLPPHQKQLEDRFRKVLEQKWGIVFNRLFSLANVPLGRFRSWLISSGNMESYMEKLISSFNPCTVEGLMCRTLISVSWNGYLFDCDFNQASRRFLGNRRLHITQITHPPPPGTPIVTDYHCYTCTAGSGFT
ncbi:MAG: arsenosugar biosynthesis radical SAM protein ArsS [Deltaproteobacteria bacterium]|nr:arsenosugar biosynthesis radical SAM protein ArsS [Deltaproteobacteria bacterium]MBW1962996.1 arsenosugar biosynthesis radical SAM protein ArsS [Deltaproteobacteria bacterium]MBW1993181.1 arsenosugar biosynthesis radical SAM protein ArsS [Deltaproteobacteria bacterium]MBW2151817.1 arsenosugar biosynthesis radical SAM protein ArsS [Deltaproteobacteria bacterium]